MKEKEFFMANRFNITVLIVFSVLVLSIVLLVSIFSVRYICRPYSSNVLVDGIEKGIYQTLEIKINDTCYLLDGDVKFVERFSFDRWELTDDKSSEAPVTQIHFAEQWTLKLYADGQAKAHYGYASSNEKPSAYYKIPTAMLARVNDYIQNYGETVKNEFHNSIFY